MEFCKGGNRMKLKDKVAIITGGAKGIGKACVETFAEEGTKVVIVDIDEKSGRNLEKKLSKKGKDIIFISCDISCSQPVQDMIRETVKTFGKIDILVNNAGIHISKSAEELSEEEWDRLIDINLKSFFLCAKYAIPELKKTKGSIVNMSSMVGLVGQSNACAYSASKGGIVAMTQGMALDFARYGIRVNCVCPGWVETPLVEDWFTQQKNPDAARKYIYSVHPLGRISTTEEVAKAVVFLASPDASFITGVALPVDGAVTLGY